MTHLEIEIEMKYLVTHLASLARKKKKNSACVPTKKKKYIGIRGFIKTFDSLPAKKIIFYVRIFNI